MGAIIFALELAVMASIAASAIGIAYIIRPDIVRKLIDMAAGDDD